MAQYRVLTRSFIDNLLVEEGAIVEFDGKPGSNLELVEAEKPKAQKAAGTKSGKGGKDAAVPADAEQGE